MQFDNFKIKRLLALIDFLEKSNENTLTMKAVEQTTHYSYRNINRIFKLFFGKSIGRYHKEKLLEASADQIQYSEKPITEIAYDLGYSDLQAFNKAFKKMYEQSPAQFRESKKINLKKCGITNGKRWSPPLKRWNFEK